eukprot:CAMPEP_0176004470 /NCGR_PEP_ID=MMETSP0120_2-20121206/1710_1 /TAXON_ID=160619 /ORGANISM="Kryptoperidinium foliaceum, Strain CCMP 1326" /LENGTH=165 /DNA_ID=CAMNT_0017337153 /DNA_START=86 /DNA_END=583 /DNA_ORIENTATION=+
MTNPAAQAFIAVLRCEAHQAEERAKALRTTAAAIEANNSEEKKRKRSTPEKAKVPPDAKTLFVNENLPQMKKNHPDLSHREIVSIIEQQWEGLAEAEKQTWKNLAESKAEPFPTIPGAIPEIDEGEDDDATSDEDETDGEGAGLGKRQSIRKDGNGLASVMSEEV